MKKPDIRSTTFKLSIKLNNTIRVLEAIILVNDEFFFSLSNFLEAITRSFLDFVNKFISLIISLGLCCKSPSITIILSNFETFIPNNNDLDKSLGFFSYYKV